VTAGAIKQSAIDLYIRAVAGRRGIGKVITPTQAVTNHCAELELSRSSGSSVFYFETATKTTSDQDCSAPF